MSKYIDVVVADDLKSISMIAVDPRSQRRTPYTVRLATESELPKHHMALEPYPLIVESNGRSSYSAAAVSVALSALLKKLESR